MKRLLIITILFWGFNLQAQENIATEERSVSIGLRAGYLNSGLVGKDKGFLAQDGKIKNENSWMIGVSLDNPISQHWGFKHEVFYQQYGARFDREMNGHVFDANLSMYGLRIHPISLAFQLQNLSLYVGPYTNVLLNSSITAVDENGQRYSDHSIYGSPNNDQDGTYYIQNMDYGLVLGAEYRFDFGGILGIQYSRGFATILDQANKFEVNGPEAGPDPKIYNQSLSVFLGYQF